MGHKVLGRGPTSLKRGLPGGKPVSPPKKKRGVDTILRPLKGISKSKNPIRPENGQVWKLNR